MSDPSPRARDRTLDRLPQKPPFLFIDEILSLEPLEAAVGAVVFPRGHRIFEGHLPDDPIVPGVIVTEALAQLSGLLAITEDGGSAQGYLASVDRMRFRRLVRPGERLVLRSRLVRRFGSAARFDVAADVDGVEVAAGSLTIAGMR